MHTVRVSWLALYYALTHYALLALPSRFAAMRRVSTLVPSSRQEGAPCIWPCALADGGCLSSTSTPSSSWTRDGISLPPLAPLSLSLSLCLSVCLSLSLSFLFGSFLRRFSLPRIPSISLPRSWSLSAVGVRVQVSVCVVGTPRDLLASQLIGKRRRPRGIPERRFPPAKGTRYRTGIPGEPENRALIVGVPRRRRVFQFRDAT